LSITHNTVNDTGNDGMTLLMHAAGFGRLVAITHLLNNNAFIDKKTNKGEGYTALDFALFNGQLDAVRMLVGRDARVNIEIFQDHLYGCMLKSKSELFEGDITLFSAAIEKSAMAGCGTPSPSFIAKFKKILEGYNKEIAIELVCATKSAPAIVYSKDQEPCNLPSPNLEKSCSSLSGTGLSVTNSRSP
jgi:hypothetical protein